MIKCTEPLTDRPFPCEPVDLTLANRVLSDLAKQEGDLAAAYWNSVLNLLAHSGRMHAELLSIRNKKWSDGK
ncbi:hypothetical protein [Bordetella genomosp. 12]|uniref:hypothetical protein n=1 Tax=Bordetella genomosp. 12 TaxID=463035 RepID=UPI001177B4D3|nr:hypothetical protein [Bordetella genomosp. 12]